MYEKVIRGLTGSGRIIGRNRSLSSVVFVPFMWINNEWHLVFQLRAAGIRQGGEVSFPGGRHDPASDKSFEQTAVRETVEEMGISPDDICIDGYLGALVAPMGAVIDVYVGRIILDSIDSFKISKDEVEKVFTVPAMDFIVKGFEKYNIHIQVNPYRKTESGGREMIFPAKELGLPERYHGSWGGMLHEVYIYRTEHGVIWGLTAEIIREMVDLAVE
ncbi:MAG TPA: CoA pyrophosphatase [Spirochaetota bacterium]|nr:CoA pyrophosphatase [Spirochaetota bacterium]